MKGEQHMKPKISQFWIAAVALIAIACLNVSCKKKYPTAAASTISTSQESDSESAFSGALRLWRETGGVLNVDELTTSIGSADSQNAAPLHEALFATIYSLTDQEKRVLANSSITQHDARVALTQSRQAEIVQIKQAARTSYCNWNTSFEDGLNAELPYLGYLRWSARLLCADAIVQANAGNLDEAIEGLECALHLSRHASAGNVVISMVVGLAIEADTLNAIDAICKDAPSRSLIQLVPLLRKNDLRRNFAKALQTDTVLHLAEGRYVQAGSRTAIIESTDGKTFIDATFATEITRYLTASRVYIQQLQQPHYLQRGTHPPAIPSAWLGSAFSQPDFYSANQSVARTELRRSVTILALQIREASLRKGNLPNLDQLGPMVDPYDGKLITFTRTSSDVAGFRVTSSARVGEPPARVQLVWK